MLTTTSRVFRIPLYSLALLTLWACDQENNGVNTPPVASNVIIRDINGDNLESGDLLVASYSYSDVDGDEKGGGLFRWLRDGLAIPGASTTQYTLTSGDIGAAITFEVRPVAQTGESPGVAVIGSIILAGETHKNWDPDDFETVYDVGPSWAYADPSEVPWESLGPSTLVRIHWRAEPYRHKWVINTVATESNPLVIAGIPNGDQLPVISGENATTREALSYWNERRSIIKVGGSNLPSDDLMPAHIIIDALEVRAAHPDHTFADDAGNSDSYASNAAAIHLEKGTHITVRNCILHDSGNGLFSGAGTSNVTISHNYIYNNGIENSIYHHNSYTESLGIVFEYNRYGPLRSGAGGNNLKDRSAGTVIRYNWIESGNRQLDLVDTDYFEAEASYRSTFVYGNVLIEPDSAGNSQIIHYGGDSGETGKYRKGTLYFYNNTVVSTRTGNTTLLRLSSDAESADVRNNIIEATAGGDYLAISAGQGDTALYDNWLSDRWATSHESLIGTITSEGNITSAESCLNDVAAQDFTLSENAACIDAATELAPNTPELNMQYLLHQKSRFRKEDGYRDMGAFEQ